MVADLTTKPLQGKKFFEFRDRIMVLSNSENNAEVQKVGYDIARNEDLQNGQKARGLGKKKFTHM